MLDRTDLIVLQMFVELVYPLPEGLDVAGHLGCLCLSRDSSQGQRPAGHDRNTRGRPYAHQTCDMAVISEVGLEPTSFLTDCLEAALKHLAIGRVQFDQS